MLWVLLLILALNSVACVNSLLPAKTLVTNGYVKNMLFISSNSLLNLDTESTMPNTHLSPQADQLH